MAPSPPRWLLLAACCQAALCLRAAFPQMRRTQPPQMAVRQELTPEGQVRAALAQPSGAWKEPVLLKNQQAKSLPKRLKDAAIVSVVKASERLWMDVFKECDVDNDDSITRRELLVLMKRLDLEIPDEEELSRLISENDVDEDGVLDFNEFTELIRKLTLTLTLSLSLSLTPTLTLTLTLILPLPLTLTLTLTLPLTLPLPLTLTLT